ncbi:molybdopterin-dependent oxidoreductase [Actinotalea subterranea]|uniref:molybdopterin-dependent oxidoreductase n=1 Tax=Actinotalea subterranea TaxID=2607497 RepID=UPI0011EC8386|nr:molybdopterin-dependent oxidoreductase [Actinotalea subterranea]
MEPTPPTPAPVSDRQGPAARHPAAGATGAGPRSWAAAAGGVSAALTLAVAELAAAVVGPGSSPVNAVGSAFVDATPAWLKDAAIAAFGVHDKTALVVGILLVLAVVAAATGLAARRSGPLGTALVLALGAVGAVAAATRADAPALAALPSLVGAAAGAVALNRLVARAGPGPVAPEHAHRDEAGDAGGQTGADEHEADLTRSPASALPDRRAFLRAATLVTVLAAVGGVAAATVNGVGRVAVAARDRILLPRPRRSAAPVPAGAQAPVDGVVDVVTRNDDFYRIDTALTVPRVDPATWELRVHGLVEREVTLTFDELLASDLVEAHVTLACVSNPVGGDLVGNALWLGLPVRELLARAVPRPDADMVLSTSVDGFTASTPLEVLTDDRDALLAVGMNGAPLPLEHGFPVRMVVPGLYGYVSATKWVTDLEVTRFADQDAYWTVRGWSPQGPVKTSSRIEVPRTGATLPAGEVAVGGTAWAQHRGVVGVEVQVDTGPWVAATLADEISVDTWRQWSWTWDAEPGEHVIRVRAADPEGSQTGDEAPVVPDGATGWHEIRVTVRG